MLKVSYSHIIQLTQIQIPYIWLCFPADSIVQARIFADIASQVSCISSLCFSCAVTKRMQSPCSSGCVCFVCSAFAKEKLFSMAFWATVQASRAECPHLGLLFHPDLLQHTALPFMMPLQCRLPHTLSSLVGHLLKAAWTSILSLVARKWFSNIYVCMHVSRCVNIQ